MILESLCTFLNKILVFSAFVEDATGFKEPLSKEDEQKYILLSANGDEKAKQLLIEHNLRLVAHVVKKFQNIGEADDLISVGTIGLIKAINTFNPQKNAMLSTYASRCIENEILMMIRTNKKHMKNVSLEEVISSDKDGNELTYIDIISCNEPDLPEAVEKKFLVKDILDVMKQKLSQREYDVIVMRFGLDGHIPMPQREVAKKLRISRSYVSRIEMKAISDIQSLIKDLGITN